MYEYKVIPLPLRAPKVKGAKTTADRFAHGLTETLNAMAAEGWDYVRAETLPCEERKGLTGIRRTEESVLVFRRALDLAEMAGGDAHDPVQEPTLVRVWSEPDRHDSPRAAQPAGPSGPVQFRADPVLRMPTPAEGFARSEPTLRKPRDD